MSCIVELPRWNAAGKQLEWKPEDRMGESHGGIHPIKGTSASYRPGLPHPSLIPAAQRICCICEKGDARHFCDENKKYIHARCALEYLQTKQGKIIIDHGHTVRLDFKAEQS
jgi:hypothetical protein